MKRRKFIKTGLILLFILLAGIFYSCRESKEQGAWLTLQSGEAGEITAGSAEDYSEEQNLNNEKSDNEQSGKEQLNEEPSDETRKYIYIHICGAVVKPAVYKVEEDTRLFDVIQLAGGLAKDAAGDFVNQAALVEDGQRVYIPAIDEVEGMKPEDFQENESNALNSGKVDINKASREELMTLAGIGESKAESIIAYRQEHGSFKTIEEIKNINGIKDSVFNKISDMITVN